MRTFQVELAVENAEGEKEFLPIFYVMGETADSVRMNVATIVGRRVLHHVIIESPCHPKREPFHAPV